MGSRLKVVPDSGQSGTVGSSEAFYIVHGFPAMRVESGHLIIEDGTPRGSRVRRIPRIERTLKRIIINARHGGITFDALGWLQDVGISLYVLRDGQLMTSSVYSHQDAALLRAQARVVDRPAGLEITKYLLDHKMRGQAEVAGMISDDAANWIVSQLPKIESRRDVQACGLLEGAVAAQYWDAWRDVRLAWQNNVRSHWETFGARHSQLGGGMSPRYACNPANAMLNYAYGILEGEVNLACWTLGLNPILGISHKDEGGRLSLAHDLMEPVRPVVDGLMLDYWRNTEFKTMHFVETKTGVTRILDKGPVQPQIVEIVKDAVADRGSFFEWVAHRIVDESEGKRTRKRTPLTQQNRKEAQVR